MSNLKIRFLLTGGIATALGLILYVTKGHHHPTFLLIGIGVVLLFAGIIKS